MSQRRPPDDEDDDTNAFRRALREAGVHRIKVNRADPGRPKRRDPAAAERRAAAVAADTAESASHTSDGRVEPVRPSEYLDFALPDLPYRTRSQLKRGQIAWEAGLDLHGYSLDEARLELESFLKEAVGSHMRCVLVVHGKAWGSTADYPVIKSHVNAWLREWPTVLAFCSARESDGGTGAIYVLLRRRGQAL
ncbi:DNA mismatch repair protein MutS [Halomonas sp. MCCC 1A11036]|uniref:DNA mismatch repair protein MutS n=1 Tax=Billgrantia zhangzhouensis TaxID=2733481 RepID=A0ABS9AFU0_9GAMM|nr:Smr/MutS family protein [Halomonas zhangzhouensis]MCE8020622.1 DNA mismatch repair protein MutS [Halomonas zhangzhouensis]